MKAITCKEPHQLQSVDTPVPQRRSGEALLRIHRIGICGTDYHAFRGKQPFFTYPRILGHELAAEIVALDDNQEGFQVGDRVTVIPYIACGQCIACRRGKPNACVKLQVIGVHIDGGMCEYISVPLQNLMKTGQLSLDQIVLIEPLAIGAHAVKRANISKSEAVLVIGAGPIGLAAMKFAKLAGAHVIAMDTNEERLATSKRWAHADHGIMAASDVMEALYDLTNGDLPTTVIDATGNADSMMKSFSYAAHGGNVVYVSLVQADIRFHDPEFHKKELTLLGSRAATNSDFEDVIRCIQQGHVETSSYITHRAPMDDAINAFQAWLQPTSGVIKAIIEC